MLIKILTEKLWMWLLNINLRWKIDKFYNQIKVTTTFNKSSNKATSKTRNTQNLMFLQFLKPKAGPILRSKTKFGQLNRQAWLPALTKQPNFTTSMTLFSNSIIALSAQIPQNHKVLSNHLRITHNKCRSCCSRSSINHHLLLHLITMKILLKVWRRQTS